MANTGSKTSPARSKRRLLAALAALLAVSFVAQADNVLIGNTPLPPPVPHLNRPEDFFLGSGVAGGGGAGDGTWNFLVGPNYTCPNYLRHEEIRLVVDGMERPLTMDVFRARETGIFCGTKTLGDLEVYLIDYARRGEPWVARLVLIKNRSPSVRHQVRVRAYVNPIVGAGRSDWMAEDESGHACGVGLKLDTSLKCVENWCCQNWSNRCALITFNDPDVTVIRADDGYIFETGPETIAPGASWNVALYHYLHYGDQGDSDCIQWVRQRNAPNDAAACVRWWRAWFDGVAPRYSLHRIKDPRARDLVEGGLAILKMNE